MCGIAGLVSISQGRIKVSQLDYLRRSINHRGPDDSGIFLSKDRHIGLVSTRLAIQDLSQKGHMPMSYHGYQIVFNGEIYNHQELRDELIQHGFQFDSTSDTEVLLKYLILNGEKGVSKLRGMFAFCFYDPSKNSLLLARDHLGKKPLKYFYKKGYFAFASETKSLLGLNIIKAIPDYSALTQYLYAGYIPSPKTGFKDIDKLEAGSTLKLDLNSGSLTKTRFYKLNFTPEKKISNESLEKRVEDLLIESIRLRLISDVPIGCFLSGGVDSSVVAALMAKETTQTFPTFTIGFREKKYDESVYASKVSKHLKTDHHLMLLEPESIHDLDTLIKTFDEPLCDGSAYAAYYLSKYAKKFVSVVLTGEGGDESFLGYPRYFKYQDYKKLSFLKGFATSVLGQEFQKIFKDTSNKVLRKSVTLLKNIDQTDTKLYLSLSGAFKKDDIKQSFFNPYLSLKPFHGYNDPIGFAQSIDFSYYLPDDLLSKIDLASMAWGLEARTPLADSKLTRFLSKIPPTQKGSVQQSKHLLKKIASKYLPHDVIYRDKMGFSLPLDIWFQGKMKDLARDMLLKDSAFANSIFPKEYLKDLINQHTQANDNGPKIFSLIILETWANHYL